MTVINVNTVPNGGLDSPFNDFKGIDDTASQRLNELLLNQPAVTDIEVLLEFFTEAGINTSFHDGLLQWFYGYDDPCDCWHGVNVNDLRYSETVSLFNALDGVEPTSSEALSAIRRAHPRPIDFEEFAAQLSEAGIPIVVIERLSRWMMAEINDITNDVNDFEIVESASGQPVLESVNPPVVAPGDTIRLEVRNLGDRQATWVEINGYPASLDRFDPTENLIECKVPDEVTDEGDIRIYVDGMEGPSSLEVTMLPRLVEKPCPDEDGTDLRLEVLGSSAPVLIDVERTDPVTGEEITETLQTEYYCGTNSVVLRGGGANAPHPVSYSIAGVLDQSLYGLIASPFILASLNVVQLIGRKEKDALGKERTVYYFFRDGKWWRVRDNKRSHPDDPRGIDVRDNIPDPNFTEADAATAEILRKQFFPTGWEQSWQEFEESQRVQMQLMWAIAWQMAGGDADSAKLLFDVKKGLDDGETIDEILAKHWKKILFGVVLGVAVGNAGKILRILKRFFRFFFPKLITKITKIIKNGDDITLATKPEVRVGNTSGKLGKKVGGKGIDAQITGRIDRGRNVLFCTSTDFIWNNKTGRRGFARDIYLDWLERLKKFAKEKKVANVEIDIESVSKEGAEMAEKMGFSRVGKTASGGIKWTKMYPVE